MIRTYYSKDLEQEIIKSEYIPHIRHRREEKKYNNRHPARRLIIGRTNSLDKNRFRKLFKDIKEG
ncbi:MAG: hypothetical protein ACM31H_01065 [Nitrososphaerales archaeon]